LNAGGGSGAPGAALATLATTTWPAAVVPGALHIVSTPIGHLGDITLRALAVLHQAAVIGCEDTRHTRTLLAHFGIGTPTIAVHEHNEAEVTTSLLGRLARGEAVALVSDAGTPLISDPGARVVAAAVAAGHRIVPIPGASATLAALVAAGLAPHPVTLLGFLERKGPEREAQLALASRLPHAVVLFEAPGRLLDTLGDLATICGPGRRIAVARELTKHFEEVRRGTLAKVTTYFQETPARGELVLVLGGASTEAPSEDGLRAAALALRAEGLRAREIVRVLMDEHGASRNLAYRLAHET